MHKLEVALLNETATKELGTNLATLLKGGDFVSLSGELGAGKSTLARSMIRYLMQEPELEVPSPSFALIQEYFNGDLTIYHCDLYRINNPLEILQLDLNILTQCNIDKKAIYLVEWANKADNLLREANIKIILKEQNEGRIAIIESENKL